MHSVNSTKHLTILVAFTVALIQIVSANQGCPFDNGSCQEYCNQQGCNMGYCGHFAWIQCICRKCGDEWNWYDKVRYNPDKMVNQTELDSLKLNGSAPIILTNSADGKPSVLPKLVTEQQTKNGDQKQQAATLTTLLIPDLSDSSKLNLNDIPDENSEKFLDYLANNHEKLVQKTAQQKGAQQASDDESGDSETDDSADSTTATPTTDSDQAAETVEIQISSSSNGSPPQLITLNGGDADDQEQRQAAGLTRLLKMAVVERASEEID